MTAITVAVTMSLRWHIVRRLWRVPDAAAGLQSVDVLGIMRANTRTPAERRSQYYGIDRCHQRTDSKSFYQIRSHFLLIIAYSLGIEAFPRAFKKPRGSHPPILVLGSQSRYSYAKAPCLKVKGWHNRIGGTTN